MDYLKILSLAEKNKNQNLKNAQKKVYSTEIPPPKRDIKHQINFHSPAIQTFIAQRIKNNSSKNINLPNTKILSKCDTTNSGSQNPKNKTSGDKLKEPLGVKTTQSIDKTNNGKSLNVSHEKIKPSAQTSVKNGKIITEAHKITCPTPQPLNYQELLKLAEEKQKPLTTKDGILGVGKELLNGRKSLERQMEEMNYRMYPPKKRSSNRNSTLPPPPSNRDKLKLNLDGPLPQKGPLKPSNKTPGNSLPHTNPNVKLNFTADKRSSGINRSHSKSIIPKVASFSSGNEKSSTATTHHLLYCRPVPTKPELKGPTRLSSTQGKAVPLKLPRPDHRGMTSQTIYKSNMRNIPRHLLPDDGRIPSPRGIKRGRSVSENEESDEEYESDLDSFLDDDVEMEDDDYADYSKHIKDIFGYDKKRFANERYEDIKETSFREQMKEEAKSARLGKMEDIQDIKMEKKMLMEKLKKKSIHVDKNI